MALFITLPDDVYQWHVGEENPIPGGNPIITSIQADGDELEYIYDHFRNIPKCYDRRVVTWHGIIASFIAVNLV